MSWLVRRPSHPLWCVILVIGICLVPRTAAPHAAALGTTRAAAPPVQTLNCATNYLINTTFDTGAYGGWSVGGNDTTQLVAGANGSTYALGLAPDDDEPRPPEQPATAATIRDVALTAGQLYCIAADLRADGLDQPITIAIGPTSAPAQAAVICSGGTTAFQRCAASYRAATTTTYRITVQHQHSGTLSSRVPHLAAPLTARTRLLFRYRF